MTTSTDSPADVATDCVNRLALLLGERGGGPRPGAVGLARPARSDLADDHALPMRNIMSVTAALGGN